VCTIIQIAYSHVDEQYGFLRYRVGYQEIKSQTKTEAQEHKYIKNQPSNQLERDR
jgi:hypothetical protein